MDQVAEVKSKTDIVSIIGERIEVKKAGRNYKANCPFHGEKTASFMISPELQIFKCFGCAEAGDVFTFLEKYEGMDFGEALKYLADKAGVKLKPMGNISSSDKEKLIEIHRSTLDFYTYFLHKAEIGKRVMEYLVKDRGLKKETIEEFGIGYSPENRDSLTKYLVEKKKYDPRDVEKSGIGIVKGGGVYDRFRGRVTFPLFDHRGNVIGFSGRILPWQTFESAKYINSPETLIYHKSSVLYGLNITRGFIKKKGVAILVEGELDAISSYQAGIKNVVAIKGSALTEEQVRLLSRFAEKFILALDSDMAGNAAARRGITIAQNLGIEVKVATIAGGKDPDEVARHDLDSYKKALIGASDAWEFIINFVFSKFDASTGYGKGQITKEIVPVLSSIENKIVQAHYAGIVAKRLGVDQSIVLSEIEKNAPGKEREAKTETVEIKSEEKDRRKLLEERLLALSLVFKGSKEVFESYKEILTKNTSIKILNTILENWGQEVKDIMDKIPKEISEGFSNLFLEVTGENSSLDRELMKKELDLVEKELKILSVRQNLDKLTKEINLLEEKGETDKLLKAQKDFNDLASTLSKLDPK